MPNDGAPPLAARTVGEPRARADAIAGRRQQLAAERLAAEQRRLAEEAGLLVDLQAIAEERGATQDFRRRLQAIRERHAQKGKFIERPRALG